MGRKKLTNSVQDKYIIENPDNKTNKELAELLGVHEMTVFAIRKKAGITKEINRKNFRNKADQYDRLRSFSKKLGYRNVSEAIDAYGSRINLLKEFKNENRLSY